MTDPSCVLCHNAIENYNHIMCACSFAKEVWSCISSALKPKENDEIVAWLREKFIDQPCEEMSKVLLICWQL